MERYFNTAGMCDPREHYMLPALRRLPTVHALVERKRYFVLHAPRQVGKSTALSTLARELSATGRYVAALLSMETGAPYGEDVGTAEEAILADWREALIGQLPAELLPPPWPETAPGARIRAALASWTRSAPRPLVVFLDEIDALHDATLEAILRQLRSGFSSRPSDFPWSLALCGMRDVRDYKLKAGGLDRSHSASPFNVKVTSLTMRNFTAEEVAELYQQHSDATGQVFTPEAIARAMALTCGQPWLVNSLARHATEELVPERAQPITREHIDAAGDAIILRRDTHVDSLAERLHEDRVRRVIEPILIGEYMPMDVMNDDLLYVRDLGLVEDQPSVRIANPIYAELIPRSLTYVMQANLSLNMAWYQRPDGSIDLLALLRAFQRFFAQNSEAWLGRYDYKEAGPHLMLMAFLQRLVNGGGRIHREFAVGSGRADLVVSWRQWRYVLELKIRYGEHSQQEGIEQLSGYLDRLGEREGYLLLFDRRKDTRWADKLFEAEASSGGGQKVHILGM